MAGEPPEVIEAAKARAEAEDKDKDYEVLPVNWPAVQLFVALQTQWHRAGMTGQRCGLNYHSIETVLRGRPDIATQEDFPELFPRIQIMEIAALNEMSK